MKGICILSPSKTAYFLKDEIKKKSIAALQQSFAPVVFSEAFAGAPTNGFATSIEDRIIDIHSAYKNSQIDLIMAYSGGFNCNQLLDYIDWELIMNNPKCFCGMSDITVLCNAIYAKTGQVTFLGPVFTQFATFGDNKADFSYEYFIKLLHDRYFKIPFSEMWSEDRWKTCYSKEEVSFFNFQDFSGTLIGGNLSSFALLCGTPYFPRAEKTVLLLEEDDHVRTMESGNGADFFFERQLTQLTQMDFFDTVQAILVGRFKKASCMNAEKIKEFLKNNPKLAHLPIIYGLDFGHTNPILTFPIGGKCRCCAETRDFEVYF